MLATDKQMIEEGFHRRAASSILYYNLQQFVETSCLARIYTFRQSLSNDDFGFEEIRDLCYYSIELPSLRMKDPDG
jgi:hypothetical protein